MIGQSLEQIRKDLRLMPTPALVQYKQNPGKQAIDGVPLDMLAGLELSRRAELQQAQVARMAPNAQMPTVVDQQAMGLMGMAQAPAVNPAMPGQTPQFSAQQPPPQPAPQAAPQQPAPEGAPQPAPQSAPQGMQMPMQPTQQQPKKMAIGGIVTLGDQMDANDQGMPYPGPYAPGQPVAMMAGGGIVAFKDNKDQPVSVNMPDSYGDPMGFGASEIVNTPRAPRGISTLERLFRQYTNEPEWRIRAADEEARRAAERAAKESSTPPPSSPASNDKANAPAVRPEDIQINQGGGSGGGIDINKLRARVQGGGSTGFDVSKLQGMINKAMEPTEAESTYRDLVTGEIKRISERPSPEVSEADRQRITKEQFEQNQAISKPHYDRIQQMLQEDRESTAARRAEAQSNARLKLGLGLLGSRAPTVGEGLKEAGLPALESYERADELLAQAAAKNRQAEIDLAKARMADEKGDREAAQRYFDSYQKNRRDAEIYEVARANMMINASKGVVDIEGKRERAGMNLQLGLERALSQNELQNARNQISLLSALSRAQGQGPKPVTVGERVALEKFAELKIVPGTPEFAQYVGRRYKGGAEQLAADLKAGRVKPDDAGFQSIIQQGRRDFINSMVQGTQRAQSPTSYDQATFDLLGQ